MLRLIADHADRNPAAVALSAPACPSLMRLCAETGEHAPIFRAVGLGKEDRVALLLADGPEGALGFLATLRSAFARPSIPCARRMNSILRFSHLKTKVLIAWSDLDAKGALWPRSIK